MELIFLGIPILLFIISLFSCFPNKRKHGEHYEQYPEQNTYDVWDYDYVSGRKGRIGEMQINSILEQLPDDYNVLEDVILKKQDGTTTQIDHLVISKYGLFAIETKNYGGVIYGYENQKEWTQIIGIKYSQKNKFYNPIKQSNSHVYEIRKQLSDWPYLKIIPIVVFVGSADLSHVQTDSHVIYDDELLNTIYGYKTIYLSERDVEHITNKINRINVRDSVSDKTHIKNVKKSKRKYEVNIKSGICPRCGGKLVRRNSKYGYFFGCSNYPVCRFTYRKK